MDHKIQIGERFIEAMEWIIYKKIRDCDSKTAFAESLGVDQQNISKIRNGIRFPTLNNVVDLHRIYGISLEWVMLNKGKMIPKVDHKVLHK